jgi:pSer/pThr/pTyr-binding forkhead associated (FHA) protein
MSAEVLLALRLGLLLALYLFLGAALYLIWVDLRGRSRGEDQPRIPPITLIRRAEDGPGQPERATRFSEHDIIIGRDPASACHLEDKTISARHTRLAYHHGQWWVEDLHSTNGTFLNHQPVVEPLVVTTGDEIRCGEVTFTLQIENQPVPHQENKI